MARHVRIRTSRATGPRRYAGGTRDEFVTSTKYISSSFQIFCFLTQSIPFVVVVVVLIALVIQRGVVLRRMTVLVRDPQAVRQVVHHVLEHPLLELVGGYRRPANGDAPGPLVKLLLLFHLEPLLKKNRMIFPVNEWTLDAPKLSSQK